MKTIINIIATAGLVLAPISAMASAGWAFDNPNVPEVPKGAGSGEDYYYEHNDSAGAGWAFDNPNVAEVQKSAGSGENHYNEHNDNPGAGWAFDHPHEPVGSGKGYGNKS